VAPHRRGGELSCNVRIVPPGMKHYGLGSCQVAPITNSDIWTHGGGQMALFPVSPMLCACLVPPTPQTPPLGRFCRPPGRSLSREMCAKMLAHQASFPVKCIREMPRVIEYP
jgi:hypothetical protein